MLESKKRAECDIAGSVEVPLRVSGKKVLRVYVATGAHPFVANEALVIVLAEQAGCDSLEKPGGLDYYMEILRAGTNENVLIRNKPEPLFELYGREIPTDQDLYINIANTCTTANVTDFIIRTQYEE